MRILSEDPGTMDIPVIFVSSRNQRADHVWARMQGAKDLLPKPVDPAAVMSHLNDG